MNGVRCREIAGGGRRPEQEGQVKLHFTTTRAHHTLQDCNLDFPRIASKRGREEGRNNINSSSTQHMHTHTHTKQHTLGDTQNWETY